MKRGLLKNILIVLVITAIVLGPIPFEIKKVEAQGLYYYNPYTNKLNPAVASTTSKQMEESLAEMECFSWGSGFNFTACAVKFLYFILVLPSGIVLWLAGKTLDISVGLSLTDAIYSAGYIKTGWVVCRDFANLFFIFILLYIAIATILQLSSYGAKQMLVKFVAIAIFINFSLLISGFIINASNILAREFYNKLSQPKANINFVLSNVEIQGVSAIFMYSFQPAKLLGPDGFGKIKSLKDSGQITDVTFGISLIVLFLFAFVVELVAAFVLLTAAVLFIIRIAVLSILMILAPIAFLSMLLPKMGSHANKWWDKLFNQSFFAPAYLFLFYLAAQMISSDFVKGIGDLAVKVANQSQGIAQFLGIILSVLIPFIIVVVFMLMAITIAKEMGAVGASAMQNWGNSIKNKAQGYAGKLPGRLKAGAAAAARRATAPAAEAFATGESQTKTGKIFGAIGKGARKIPIIGGALTKGAASIAAAQRKKIEEVQGDYKKYTTAELQNMVSASSKIKPVTRTAIIKELSSRGELKKVAASGDDESILKDHRRYLKRYGMDKDLKEFDRLRPDLIDESTEPGFITNEKGEKEPLWRKARDRALASANWANMDKEIVKKIFENPDEETRNADTDAIIKGSTSAAIRKLIEDVGGDAEKQFFESLKKFGTTIEGVSAELSKLGNHSLAGWVQSGPGMPIMKAHGFVSQKDLEEQKKKQEEELEEQKKKQEEEEKRRRYDSVLFGG